MTARSPASMPEQFVSDVRDALGHLYDSAYLLGHPLLRSLPALAGQDQNAAVRMLRKVLLETVEGLRPPPGTPEDDLAWRPYRVIWHRFVVGKGLATLEEELSLGKRQIQREQRRGIEAVCLSLWESIPRPEDSVSLEITRIATSQKVDLKEQLQRALLSVEPLACRLGATLREEIGEDAALVVGDPALCRQLLVAGIAFVLRLVPGGSLTINLRVRSAEVVLSLLAGPAAGQAALPTELTEVITTLAQSQGVSVRDGAAHDCRDLVLSFPAAPAEYLVAVVDDNEDVIALFSRYLSGHGYKLAGVSESRSAVERIAQLHPDAILVDVVMHDLDGWEVLRRLRANAETMLIPVVVCSVLNEPDLASSLGADAYLHKPVRPAQLLACLSGLLPHRHSAVGAP